MSGRAVDEHGEIYTQADVEREILRVSHELEDLTGQLVQLARTAKQAEASYKVAFAKARMMARAEGGSGPSGRTTNDEADDRALSKTEPLYVDYLVKSAVWESTRDAMFTKRSQIDALRTIAANIRAQS